MTELAEAVEEMKQIKEGKKQVCNTGAIINSESWK